MRWSVLLVLGACVDGDDRCRSPLLSELTHRPRAIASGTDLVGITWTQHEDHSPVTGAPPPTFHAAIVSPDGSIGGVLVTQAPLQAVPGTTTVLWQADATGPIPFAVRLQRASGGAEAVTVTDEKPHARAATFDGVRYQLFWVTDTGSLQHRSLTEDGVLGAVRELDTGIFGVYAASGAAGVLLQVGSHADIVDTNTGMLQRVFEGDPTASYDPAFWFAGEFHIRDGGRLFSFDGTGNARTQFLIGDLIDARRLYPGATTLFATTPTSVVEVDAALSTVRHHPPAASEIGTFGPDLVRFEPQAPDPSTQTPGRIELVRDNVWRFDLAVDTPLRPAPGHCDVTIVSTFHMPAGLTH